MNAQTTILVVDDNAVLLRGMHRALTKKGFLVIQADSPQAAIDLWSTHCQSIDLLLTDVVMPGMTGLELADQLRGQKPGLRVVVISGFLPEVLRPVVESQKLTRFLEKPFKFSKLIDSVRDCLATN